MTVTLDLPVLDFNLDQIDFEVKNPLLGMGTSRKVFQVSDYWVAKVPLNDIGILQNKNEVSIYNEFKHSKYEKLLAPCFALESNNIILMRKANGLPLLKTMTISDYLKEKFPTIQSYDRKLVSDFIRIAYLHMDDIYTSDAWGILNEELVLLDYGCSSEIFRNHYSF